MDERPYFYTWDRDTDTLTPATVEQFAQGINNIRARRVAIWTHDLGYTVSTVFLGSDHNFNYDRPGADQRPVLFETLITAPDGSAFDQYMERYCTYDEARAGHLRAARMVQREIRHQEAFDENVWTDGTLTPDWDDLARIALSAQAGSPISRAAWRAADEAMDGTKTQYGRIARDVITAYHDQLRRKKRVLMRRDDLEFLNGLLGPSRGAIVTRVRRLLDLPQME